MKIRIAAPAALVAICLSLAGCNADQTAQRAHDIVAGIIAVAQADLPSLEATGVFSDEEGVAVAGYLALATNLNARYQLCITDADSATLKRSSKFLACLNTFSVGLSDPKALTAFRVMSPKAQQEVQLWITASTVAINSVIATLGGNPQSVPKVAQGRPTTADLQAFARRLPLRHQIGF